MEFDKNAYKRYYGKPYLNRIYEATGCVVAANLVTLVCVLLAGRYSAISFAVWMFAAVFSIGITLYLCITTYLYNRKMAGMQTIKFVGKEIHLHLVVNEGEMWEKVYVTKDVAIYKLTYAKLSARFIHLAGDMRARINDSGNETVTVKKIRAINLPRCFSNEEKLLQAVEEAAKADARGRG